MSHFSMLPLASPSVCHPTIWSPTGRLPSPENIHINQSMNSTIEWNPPYYSMNSDNIHVDPHITQYTVYITDNHTGNIITKNVTETQFTFNISDDLCPTYHVSAWNTGGESNKSICIHHSKLPLLQVE